MSTIGIFTYPKDDTKKKASFGCLKLLKYRGWCESKVARMRDYRHRYSNMFDVRFKQIHIWKMKPWRCCVSIWDDTGVSQGFSRQVTHVRVWICNYNDVSKKFKIFVSFSVALSESKTSIFMRWSINRTRNMFGRLGTLFLSLLVLPNILLSIQYPLKLVQEISS